MVAAAAAAALGQAAWCFRNIIVPINIFLRKIVPIM